MKTRRITMGPFLLAVAAAAMACGMVSCKSREARSAGFVDKESMSKDPTLPFHRTWVKPGFDKAAYSKLYVAPVNTSYMLNMTEWQQGMKKADIEADVAKLAAFTRDAITKAFRDDPRHRFQIVSSPAASSDTLTIEVALIEVVPSKAVLNALGYAPFFIGLTVTTVRAIADDVSSVAFEARIRDAGTGEIVAMAADREVEQRAVVSVRGLTWYSHAEAIIKDWAVQFVQIANRKPGETVKDTEAFTLSPW